MKNFQIAGLTWKHYKKAYLTPVPILGIVAIFTMFTVVIDYFLKQDMPGTFSNILLVIYLGLAVIFYPFVHLWVQRLRIYQHYFPKLGFIGTFKTMYQKNKEIDRTTPDDVRYSKEATHVGYNTWVVSDTERHSRETAEGKKEYSVAWYLMLRHWILGMILLLVFLLTPILVWFVMPGLVKAGLVETPSTQVATETEFEADPQSNYQNEPQSQPQPSSSHGQSKFYSVDDDVASQTSDEFDDDDDEIDGQNF